MAEDECGSGGRRWRILVGDITRLAVDAIVNPADDEAAGGGGAEAAVDRTGGGEPVEASSLRGAGTGSVEAAIHRAAGPELLEAFRSLGPCPPGDAVITPGYRLPAEYVIHAVGPVWRGGDEGEDELLASCYRQAFRLAASHRLRTIALPAISTGARGFPHERASRLALLEVKHELERGDDPERPDRLSCVSLVLAEEEHARVWGEAAREVFPPWTADDASTPM